MSGIIPTFYVGFNVQRQLEVWKEARTTDFLSFRDTPQGKVNVRKLAALVQIAAVILGERYQY
jgi:hypothetical protein